MNDLAAPGRSFLRVVGAAAAFGMLAFFATLALRDDVNPFVFVSCRFVVAGLALVGAARLLRRVPRTIIMAGLALGAAVYAVQAIFLTLALERSTTSVVAVLFGTYPLFVFLLLLPRHRDLMRPAYVGPLLGVILGGALLVGAMGAASVDLVGALLAIASAIAFALFVTGSNALTARVPPSALAWLCCVGAAASTLLLTISLGRFDLDFETTGWLWIAAAGLMSTAFAFSSLFRGLPRVGPAAAGVILGTEPVVTVLLAVVFLGDHLSPTQVFGGAIAVGSAAFLQRFLAGQQAASHGTAPDSPRRC